MKIYIIFFSDAWWLHHFWRFGLSQFIGQKVKDSNLFHFILSYRMIFIFLHLCIFIPECEILFHTSANRIWIFKNCHSFQNCEIFTCPENWNSLCCRFFVLVKNFSRLPKSRLAILVRELQFVTIYRTMPASEVNFTNFLAPSGALYVIMRYKQKSATHFFISFIRCSNHTDLPIQSHSYPLLARRCFIH